jgi:hypothetical protein
MDRLPLLDTELGKSTSEIPVDEIEVGARHRHDMVSCPHGKRFRACPQRPSAFGEPICTNDFYGNYFW